VIVFAPRYDVSLGLFSQESYMQADRRRRRSPDRYDIQEMGAGVRALLEPWGVTIEPALVMDATHTGKINLPHVVRRDNMEYQGTKEFEYPLFVHTTEMDPESVLVRSLPGIVLPFASPLSFEAPEGVELRAVPLVRTSDQAVAFPHPGRYWSWSAASEAQEQIAKTTTRAWNAVAKDKDADAEARAAQGKELKRSLRKDVEQVREAATGFQTLSAALAERDDSDEARVRAGKAKDLLNRIGAVGTALSAVEDKDLEGISARCDELLERAGDARTELEHLAWRGWLDTFGGEAGDAEPPKLELVPTSQIDLATRMDGKGQRTLVLMVEGEFPSAFASGEHLPAGLTEQQRKDRLVSGPGRLLVIGSDLGLRLPDPEWVFEGIDPENFVPGPEMVRPQLRVDNWQLQIGQVGRSLTMDGIPFLLNTLDWAVQRMALADIRAKQNPMRRIRSLESKGSRTAVEITWIGGLPLVFLLFGLGYWQWRSVRRRRLRDRYAAGSPQDVTPAPAEHEEDTE
jgi:hypothetical protein